MTARRRSRGEAFLLRLPSALLEFPFEVLMAAFGVLVGIGVCFGLLEPNSIAVLLPELARFGWGAGMGVGGLTLGVGLAKRSPGATSSGLRLVGVLCAVYAVALVVVAGFAAAGVVAGLFLVVGLLALLRALYVSVVASMMRHVAEES